MYAKNMSSFFLTAKYINKKIFTGTLEQFVRVCPVTMKCSYNAMAGSPGFWKEVIEGVRVHCSCPQKQMEHSVYTLQIGKMGKMGYERESDRPGRKDPAPLLLGLASLLLPGCPTKHSRTQTDGKRGALIIC